MSDQEKRFQEQLLATFKDEARERIAAMGARLGELERADANDMPPIVEAVFREAHSLKAAARAVNQKGMELVCQAMESIFAALKRGEGRAAMSGLFGALWDATDALSDFLATMDSAPDSHRQRHAATLARALDTALGQLKLGAASPQTVNAAIIPLPVSHSPRAHTGGEVAANDVAAKEGSAEKVPVADPDPEQTVQATDAKPTASIAMADTVRLSANRLSTLLLQVEEMLADKLAARQLAANLNEAMGIFSAWRRELNKAVAAGGARQHSSEAAAPLPDIAERNERHLAAFEAKFSAAVKAAGVEARSLGSKVDRLHQDMKKVLTQQCATLFELYPRVVRELARDQSKDVELVIRGAELEIDRRILEELKDPLLHIVRNCVDHGIEKPADRLAAGKPAKATIVISTKSQDGDKVEFTIADDGRGISVEKLAAAAIKGGLLAADRVPSDPAEIFPLIFQSGISTSPFVTDISGRGLGLAIVRETIERLSGTITVTSRPGLGTTFRAVLPLTLAAYRGIAVRCAGQAFVLPTLNVDRVARVSRSKISTVENRTVLDMDGIPISLVRLRDVLELPAELSSIAPGENVVAVVLGTANGRIAFEVDGADGDQEILVKPLGKCFTRVRNIQGATILAAGAVAPILNVNDLLKSALRIGRRGIVRGAAPLVPAEKRTKNILIAEDSITARGLLKNILESAGYHVKTAVDGLEAWATLKLERFDLLVSDVEMPGINGFDLTARIRADKDLSPLPVVLVTALGSREDRERGVDVGANAYIIKGGFERGSLLDAVKRLA